MTGWELEFEDTFAGPELDRGRWLPYYLPQWSSRELAAARYELRPGGLRLLIEEDQRPWCPQYDGDVRVSSLQTGVLSGPLGSEVGQHRFTPRAVVHEEQPIELLYTPHFARVEIRMRALDDPRCMCALWMIGIEDVPEHSAEICVVEIFGSDVGPASAKVGMGVHAFRDPRLEEAFEPEALAIDVREPHLYAAEWTPEHVAFSVDGEHVKTVGQSPDYPMQLMLGIYEFPGEDDGRPYPKAFDVESVRGYRALP
jgi:hypothetical protein